MVDVVSLPGKFLLSLFLFYSSLLVFSSSDGTFLIVNGAKEGASGFNTYSFPNMDIDLYGKGNSC